MCARVRLKMSYTPNWHFWKMMNHGVWACPIFRQSHITLGLGRPNIARTRCNRCNRCNHEKRKRITVDICR